MAPSLLLVLGVLAYPVAWELWVSLTDFSSHSTGAAAFVGLANYARLAQDVDFWSALLTTVLYFAVTTAAKLVLGVALALLLARPGRGRALVFLAVFLPWAYPGGVSVIGWYWMLNPPITTSYSTFMGGIKYAVNDEPRQILKSATDVKAQAPVPSAPSTAYLIPPMNVL